MLRPWKVTLGRIDPARPTPLYLQIVHAVIQEIERDRLSPGTFLPSSRELAAILGVNRKTVVLAYEDLIAQGWLASQGTRGTCVAEQLIDRTSPKLPPGREAGEIRPDYRFRAPPARALALGSAGGIKLDEGAPDGRLFPADILARAIAPPSAGRAARTGSSTAIRAGRPDCARRSRPCCAASAGSRSIPTRSASRAAVRTASTSLRAP